MFEELKQVQETKNKLKEVYLNIYKDKLIKYAGHYILVNDAKVTLSDGADEYYIILKGKGLYKPSYGVLSLDSHIQYLPEASAPITDEISLDATGPVEKLPIVENDTARTAIIAMSNYLERVFKDDEIK